MPWGSCGRLSATCTNWRAVTLNSRKAAGVAPTPSSARNGLIGTCSTQSKRRLCSASAIARPIVRIANPRSSPRIGRARANLRITPNVTLLVVPAATVPLQLDATGSGGLSVAIPNDAVLCGGIVDFQAAFLDSGAADNVSHTEGLEWRVGSYEQ